MFNVGFGVTQPGSPGFVTRQTARLRAGARGGQVAESQTAEVNKGKPEILVIDDGLFFSVRIETTLKKLGYAVQVAYDSATAIAMTEHSHHVLAIVNFGSDGLGPADVVRRLKTLPDPPAVLGFVSHTWIPRIQPGAMEAGCDLLVANSALTMRLPQLVAKLAPLDGSTRVVPTEAEYED